MEVRASGVHSRTKVAARMSMTPSSVRSSYALARGTRIFRALTAIPDPLAKRWAHGIGTSAKESSFAILRDLPFFSAKANYPRLFVSWRLFHISSNYTS